jgi:2-C-methyl-D-erythritol 2,4-cyclodiphosphate synthase
VIRVGIGYDSHRFANGRPLVLGGVVIPHPLGLKGHSDADAIAHAIADAMLGAAGLGDIGCLYPDTDPAHQNADSMKILTEVSARVRNAGWLLQNTDVTVIVESPRIAPHVPAMRSRLCQALGIDTVAISLKAKTNEGMGFIGRGEGIAVIAVASLFSPLG